MNKLFLIAASVALSGCTALADGAHLVRLGHLSDDMASSSATAISGDGRVVGGGSTSLSGYEAFLWSRETGLMPIGDLPGGSFQSTVSSMSWTGDVAVGRGSSAMSVPSVEGGGEAYRWDAIHGMVALGDLPTGRFNSSAIAVSADGSTVVGYGSITFNTHAVLWRDGQMIDLGTLPGGQLGSSIAYDVSADGRVVVGISESANAFTEGFRWTAETGMVGFGVWPGWADPSDGTTGARMVSDDGSIVLGGASAPQGGVMWRWTEEEGMVPLNFIGVVWDSNESCSVMVGDIGQPVVNGHAGPSVGPFIWDECFGLRGLRTWLPERHGLDFGDYLITFVWGVSSDGRTIVGSGVANHVGEGFVLYLPPLLEGDLDDSGAVDAGDAAIFAERMAGPDGGNTWCRRADLVADGRIDLRDYVLLQRLVEREPCETPVAGDLDGDCTVSAADAAELGTCMNGPDALSDCPAGDFDEDQDVDLADMVVWQRLFAAE